MKSKEEIYEKHVGSNMELQYLPTPKENVLAAMEEYAQQQLVPSWVKASERQPPNWFTAKLRNIEQGVEINLPVKAVLDTMIEFETGSDSYLAHTYINNIEWLDEQPAAERAAQTDVATDDDRMFTLQEMLEYGKAARFFSDAGFKYSNDFATPKQYFKGKFNIDL